MAIVDDLDYPNFKDAVAKAQGHDRAKVYGKVWYDLLPLTDVGPALAATANYLSPAFGGAVIDADGRILLMEPPGSI
jgi:hypothetical protein